MKEALARDDGDLRLNAATEKYDSMVEPQVFKLERQPKYCEVIGSKWVFKTKTNVDAFMQKYKAPFVAKGFYKELGWVVT